MLSDNQAQLGSTSTPVVNFRTVFQAMPTPCLLLSADEKFIIIDVNDAYLRVTLTTPEQIIGQAIFEAFPDNPEDLQATGVSNLRASLKRVLANKIADKMEIQKYDIAIKRVGTPEFEERYWSPLNIPIFGSQSEVVAIIHRVEDVTDFIYTEQQKNVANALLYETQQHLFSTNTKLQLSLKAARLGLWRWNIIENQLELDDISKELFDLPLAADTYTLADVISRVHPEDRPLVEEAFRKCIDDGTPYDVDFRLISANLSEMYLVARGEALRAANGRIIALLSVSWDITGRKQLEQERWLALKLAEEQKTKRIQEAETSRKQQIDFIDMVCHEIRNPLTGALGGISLLQEDYAALEALVNGEAANFNLHVLESFNAILAKMDEQIEVVKTCTEYQNTLVSEVLDLSKLEQAKVELYPVVCQPKLLIEQALRMIQVQAEQKNLAVITSIAPECNEPVLLDAHRLLQVLINLFNNAIKFTFEGSITIRAAIIESSAELGRVLQMSIEDTGIGMTADELERLFDRFAQANRRTAAQYGGSGLGLMISKRLIELMGGRLDVESEKIRGTCFRFSVMAHNLSYGLQDKKKQHPAKLNFDQQGNINLLNKTILIVEDNIINQKVLVKHLEHKACLCQVANNGQEAVEKYEQFQFDVIFMDIEMPIMGGIAATKEIRQKEQQTNRHIPIIGLSGNARKEQIDEALAAGMDLYLTKPYKKEDVFAAITHFTGINITPSPESSPTILSANSSPAEDNAAIITQSDAWQKALERFKREAVLLLEQQLPFNLTEQDEGQLTLELSPSPPQLSYYYCKLALKDLKENLQMSLSVLKIKKFILFESHLKIIVANPMAAPRVKLFLQQVGILPNPPCNAVASASQADDTSQELVMPRVSSPLLAEQSLASSSNTLFNQPASAPKETELASKNIFHA